MRFQSLSFTIYGCTVFVQVRNNFTFAHFNLECMATPIMLYFLGFVAQQALGAAAS